MEEMSMEAAPSGARELQARLYREIGVAAVATALGLAETAPLAEDCEHLAARAA